MWALNRQGRAPFVVSSSGHEAVQVASVFAFDPEVDWLLPYYRDMGVALAWGSPVVDVLAAVFTRKTDPTSGGRQLPNHWSDPDRRVLTHSSTIATQYPHAAGIAQALRLDGRPGVVAVYGGEGSTSEGDWHEMMNFAGIHSLPLICIIENNRYAISVAEAEQVGRTDRRSGQWLRRDRCRGRWKRPARRLRGGPRGGRPGPSRCRRNAGRGPHLPLLRTHLGRRRSALPNPRGSGPVAPP